KSRSASRPFCSGNILPRVNAATKEVPEQTRSLENLISELRLELPGNQTLVEVNRSDVHANKTN
nr:Avr9 elicitor response protein [Tanacetum cinerariifolium]